MLGSLGLKCIGPEPIRNSLITRRCPEGATIDLDTARLNSCKAKGIMTLSARCIACQAVINIRQFLTKQGTEIQPEDTVCVQSGCVLQAVHMSGKCPRHLGSLLTEGRRENTAARLSAA